MLLTIHEYLNENWIATNRITKTIPYIFRRLRPTRLVTKQDQQQHYRNISWRHESATPNSKRDNKPNARLEFVLQSAAYVMMSC